MLETLAEAVHIPLFDLQPYEAAAAFFAVLAYPEDAKARARFERAIRFKAIERKCRDLNWATASQTLRPYDLLQDRKSVEREYKRGVRVIKQARMIAAKMAAPTDCNIASLEAGKGGKGAGGAKAREYGYLPPTSEKWLADIQVDLDRLTGRCSDLNKGNIVARCWEPSKRILHICLALHMFLSTDYQEMEYCDFNIEDYFDYAGWIMTVIEMSNSIPNTIAGLFGIPPGDLIRLSWRP